MAKDPAFLFYSDNFLSGTMFFSDEQAGKYIRLLCAQHLTGHLDEKHMLIICKSHDDDIWKKFIKDDDGKYYNERLEIEINKRKLYSESRSNNKKGKGLKDKNTSKSYDYHMGNGNGNEIEDIKFNFKSSLLTLGIKENIVSDWLKVRSKKKASNTETAFVRIKNEIEKSGHSANDCIRLAVEKNWIGFEAEWMIKLVGKNATSQPATKRKVHYMMFDQPYTHFEKAYIENLAQYGEDKVKFLNYVENAD